MRAGARGLTTQKYLSDTLIKDVPELKSLKYARFRKKVEVAGVKMSPHDFFRATIDLVRWIMIMSFA